MTHVDRRGNLLRNAQIQSLFYKSLADNLNVEVAIMGRAEGRRSKIIELTVDVLVATKIPVSAQIQNTGRALAAKLNVQVGPIEFHPIEFPSFTAKDSTRIVTQGNICFQQQRMQHEVGDVWTFGVTYSYSEESAQVIDAYEEEINSMVSLDSCITEYKRAFNRQPWVVAIYKQRSLDNKTLVPMQGRTYQVTDMQLEQLQLVRGTRTVRLLGYALIEVSEEKYMQTHFKDGKRINLPGTRKADRVI